MIYTALLIAASAALASAQVTYNSTTGIFTCAPSNPNGAYCAGDSLSTNIIIRCTNGVGQPGNCNDNLAGEFPFGVNFAPCWQTTNTSGDAACSKNCVVYGGSGNFNGTFTLPSCTPLVQSSTTTTTSTTSTTSSSSGSATSGSTTTTSTGTTTVVTGGVTITETFTTTFCPASSTTTTTTPVILPTTTPSNGTIIKTGSATATPVSPSKTSTIPFTGGAMANSAGVGLAGLGLVVAYFL